MVLAHVLDDPGLEREPHREGGSFADFAELLTPFAWPCHERKPPSARNGHSAVPAVARSHGAKHGSPAPSATLYCHGTQPMLCDRLCDVHGVRAATRVRQG